MTRYTQAFTLIELLVVVTIIVVLLAMLAPAMDKAIYQAELTVCGTEHRAVAMSVTTYAMTYRRHYPDRLTNWQSPVIKNAGAGALDDRPLFRSFLDVNKYLMCPLVPAEVDLDGETSVGYSSVIASMCLWFDQQYPDDKGMKRLGDKWTYTATEPNGDTIVHSFSLLTGPYNLTGTGGSYCLDDHQDSNAYTVPIAQQNYVAGYPEGVGNQIFAGSTGAYWTATPGTPRGTVDVNYSLADLSVRRLDRVKMLYDERLKPIPVWESEAEFANIQLWQLPGG